MASKNRKNVTDKSQLSERKLDPTILKNINPNKNAIKVEMGEDYLQFMRESKGFKQVTHEINNQIGSGQGSSKFANRNANITNYASQR